MRCVVLPLTLVRRPPSMGRPVSLLDCGVKMHANERAFREVKDWQYSVNRCFFPLVPRLDCILPFRGLSRGGIGIFSLSPFEVMANTGCYERSDPHAAFMVARIADLNQREIAFLHGGFQPFSGLAATDSALSSTRGR